MKSMLFGLAALSLAQLAAPQHAQAQVTGAINANGTSQNTTNTFISRRIGVGHYVITFPQFVFGNNAPVCIVVPIGPASVVAGLNERLGFCEIFIAHDNGVALDAVFTFTASPGTIGNGAPPATPITLLSGWTGGPFGTALPSVSNVGGVVYLKGAIAGGSTTLAFTLPAGFQPGHTVFLTTNVCSGNPGRLVIDTSGTAVVVSPNGFNLAQCFVNLDGLSFIP
jgi:hypothetical protein